MTEGGIGISGEGEESGGEYVMKLAKKSLKEGFITNLLWLHRPFAARWLLVAEVYTWGKGRSVVFSSVTSDLFVAIIESDLSGSE